MMMINEKRFHQVGQETLEYTPAQYAQDAADKLEAQRIDTVNAALATTKASAIAKLCSPTYIQLLPEEAALIVII